MCCLFKLLVVFNVSLTDENGTPMNNSIVKLVNKHFEKPVIIGTIKVINGTGNFSYVPEKSTMLDVYAFYEGNDNYTNSSSNDFIIAILKHLRISLYIFLIFSLLHLELLFRKLLLQQAQPAQVRMLRHI